MPTYEYECLECGATFERFQSITARPVRRCPVCRKGKVRRLIGAGAGLIFKGSGFYATDYRSEDYKQEAKADKDSTSPASKTDSSGDKGSSGKKKATTKDASTPKS